MEQSYSTNGHQLEVQLVRQRLICSRRGEVAEIRSTIKGVLLHKGSVLRFTTQRKRFTFYYTMKTFYVLLHKGSVLLHKGSVLRFTTQRKRFTTQRKRFNTQRKRFTFYYTKEAFYVLLHKGSILCFTTQRKRFTCYYTKEAFYVLLHKGSILRFTTQRKRFVKGDSQQETEKCQINQQTTEKIINTQYSNQNNTTSNCKAPIVDQPIVF